METWCHSPPTENRGTVLPAVMFSKVITVGLQSYIGDDGAQGAVTYTSLGSSCQGLERMRKVLFLRFKIHECERDPVRRGIVSGMLTTDPFGKMAACW